MPLRPDAGLNLVVDQQQAVLVAQLAEFAEEYGRHETHAALALDRLDHDRRRRRRDRRRNGLDVVERNLVEAVGHRRHAFGIFGAAGGAKRGQRAAVEGAGEGDDAVLLGMAADEVIAAHGLDGALDSLGAGVAEEDLVGKGQRDKLGGERLLLGDPVEIGDVPHLAGLVGQRLDQSRMGVAQRVDRDAGREIQQPAPVRCLQPDTLTARKSDRGAREDAVKRRVFRGFVGY